MRIVWESESEAKVIEMGEFEFGCLFEEKEEGLSCRRNLGVLSA